MPPTSTVVHSEHMDGDTGCFSLTPPKSKGYYDIRSMFVCFKFQFLSSEICVYGIFQGTSFLWLVIICKNEKNTTNILSPFWHQTKNILPKQVDCFFGDAVNSCRWRERRLFWVTWQNAREHLPLRCVAQFFLRASSQSSIFGFRC